MKMKNGTPAYIEKICIRLTLHCILNCLSSYIHTPTAAAAVVLYYILFIHFVRQQRIQKRL